MIRSDVIHAVESLLPENSTTRHIHRYRDVVSIIVSVTVCPCTRARPSFAHRKDMYRFNPTNVDATGVVVAQEDEPDIDERK